MPISTSDAIQVTLHRNEGNSLTPLHPSTNSEVVEYQCATADFDGNNTKLALDELFRRLGVIEGEMGSILPPLIAAPEILNPTSGYHIPLDEPLEISTSPFTMKRGEDTHAASEYRILGADKRQLWSSGEDSLRLESYSNLQIDKNTLPNVDGTPVGDSVKLQHTPDFAIPFSVKHSLGRAESEDTILMWQNEYIYGVRTFNSITRSIDGGETFHRTTCKDNTEFVSITWAKNKFVAVVESNSIYESLDKGETWTKIGNSTSSNTAKNHNIVCIDNETGEGTVLVHFSHGKTDVSVSTDGGISWEKIVCPVSVHRLMVAHGHVLATNTNGTEWACTKTGKSWVKVPGLAGMKVAVEDPVGVVGLQMSGKTVSLARVSGDLFQVTDQTKGSFSIPQDMQTTYGYDMCYDRASNLYMIAFGNSRINDSSLKNLWYREFLQEGAGSLSTGWVGLPLADFVGSTNLSDPIFVLLRGQNYLAFTNYGGKSAVRLDVVGALLSEQLYVSARHKGEKAGWSDWSSDCPFVADINNSLTEIAEKAVQKNGATFFYKRDIGMTDTFVVPEGVTELLVLCASGTTTYMGGRAASCKISVTPGESIPVKVGGSGQTDVSSFGSYISCSVAEVVCPTGKIMEFQGANGYFKSASNCGGGFMFLFDNEYLDFALHGTSVSPTIGTSSSPGLSIGWSCFNLTTGFCGGRYNDPQAGIIKVWWGDQINE